MKITFVVPSLNLSGGLRVVAKYAELLAQTHQVTIVSPAAARPTLKQQIKTWLGWKGYVFDSGFNDSYFHHADYQVRVIDGVDVLSNEHVPDADVVIATFWLTAFWVDAMSPDKGAKFYFVQGDERQFIGCDPLLVAETYRLPFFKITIAKWLAAMLQNDFGAKQIALVPNSIDHHLFHAAPRLKQVRPTIGFLYAEATFKGVETALAVIDQVKKKLSDLHVVSFGASLPQTMHLPEHCDFNLKPQQEHLRHLYASCDVWLCCSVSEGFGLTVLEAMACRTPVVTTRCGGPQDFVTENQSGYFADVGDVEALTKATVKVLNASQEEWQSLSEKAYQTARSYNWKQAAMLFEKALIIGKRQYRERPHAR